LFLWTCYLDCSPCTAGRGYLSTSTAAEQEAKANAEAHGSLWAMVGSSIHLSLLFPAQLCFSGRFSVASPFFPSIFRLGGSTLFQQGLYHRAGNTDYAPKIYL